nr:unnamed protein product [Spirometra erinaceieuropaei]
MKGTPMGSPISGCIPEAVLQRLESLVFHHHGPEFWVRYVDDTFVVIDRDQLLTFKERLNAVFSDIQFTMEEEENNQPAFLDVLVCRKDCGGLKTNVFRKATNTMQSGYIGEVPFVSKWFSRTTCYLGDVAFRCVYADDGGILGTNMTIPNITNVDTIFIDSTYPVTLHRIEDHVQNKAFKDRFIVEKDMHLTKCPKYMQTKLVWKFPGSVENRTEFECFREGMRLCKGTTTGNETSKCLVTVEGGNLVHTRVVNATKHGVEFFYCRLDPATPHRALTYNVDWRAAEAVPPGGLPTEAPVVPVPARVTGAPSGGGHKPSMVAVNTTSAGEGLAASSLGISLLLCTVLAN